MTRDDALIYGRIQRGEFSLTNYGLNTVSDEAKNLLKSLLEVDPVKRLSATEALKHPWIQSDPEMKSSSPLKTAHESLKHKLEERTRRQEERRARRNQ